MERHSSGISWDGAGNRTRVRRRGPGRPHRRPEAGEDLRTFVIMLRSEGRELGEGVPLPGLLLDVVPDSARRGGGRERLLRPAVDDAPDHQLPLEAIRRNPVCLAERRVDELLQRGTIPLGDVLQVCTMLSPHEQFRIA